MRGPATTKFTCFDGVRVRKAHLVRQVAPIFQRLAAGPVEVPELRYIKIFPQRIAASNVQSGDSHKNQEVAIGPEGLVAVDLLVDTATQRL